MYKYTKTNVNNSELFGNSISINTKRIFPVIVAATMSSGKSTLINTLLEEDVLPSQNEACTAKIFSILDDDTAVNGKIIITYKDGKTVTVDDNVNENIKVYNDDDSVESVFVIKEIKKIINSEKSLLLIDTPGPNNSVDKNHKKITENIIEKLDDGLILYIINATQIGTDDDRMFLSKIYDIVSKKTQINVLFILNKIDEIDFEKENFVDVTENVLAYLQSVGFDKPNIIPISALAANLFEKVINKKKLSRREYQKFISAYELFRLTDTKLNKYIVEDGKIMINDYVCVNGTEYSIGDLLSALDNTGITYLERLLQHKQLNGSTHKKKRLIRTMKKEQGR